MVVKERVPVIGESDLTIVTIECPTIARVEGYIISRQSLMLDHLHLALRGNIEQSPEQIALTFLNELSIKVANRPVWNYGYYVGTFGEYDMRSVRVR